MISISKSVPVGASKRNSTSSRWAAARRGPYEDFILKPEFHKRRLRFGVGTTWMRVVPAIQGSSRPWVLHVPAMNYEGGRFAHPRAVQWGAKSPFDTAYNWALKHKPTGLLSKQNPHGVRLLPVPLCVFWVIVEENGFPVARLFVGSAYDGSRGGVTGLGFHIWRHIQSRDEKGELARNALDPEAGFLIGLEKQDAKGTKYPTFTVRTGREVTPLKSLLVRMASEEIDALCPLERTIRILTEEEQWARLAKVMAPDIVATIRTSRW